MTESILASQKQMSTTHCKPSGIGIAIGNEPEPESTIHFDTNLSMPSIYDFEIKSSIEIKDAET